MELRTSAETRGRVCRDPIVAVAALLALTACGEPFDAPARAEAPVVLAEPELEAGISVAPRLRLRPRSGPGIAPSELLLFAAELTDSQLSRVRRNDVPAALAALEVPALGWVDQSGETVVRPTSLLEPGAILTLVSRSLGRLGTFDVSGTTEQHALERRWPPRGVAGAGLAVLCGSSVPQGAWAFPLEPGDAAAELDPDFGTWDGEECVGVRFVSVPPAPAFLPPEVEGIALDPAPYFVESKPVEAPLVAACDDRAVVLGPLCGVPEDDRLVLAGTEQPVLVRASSAAGAELVLVPAFGQVALRGLVPDTDQVLAGEVITLDGSIEPFATEFRTAVPRQRWVLNEVLSNPIGPEPSQEWVELYNAGSVRASLAGLVLEDGGGRVELPAVEAEPGAFVVLARHDFLAGSVDVAPASSAALVLLPELGKNGLSNSGEPLRLTALDGAVVSAFPALAGRHAGVSVARKSPEHADDDPDAFAEHAPPGASPGSHNQH